MSFESLCYANEFINNYEVIDFKIVEYKTKRVSRSTILNNKSKEEIDLELTFTSFGKRFGLLLSEDVSFSKVNVKPYNSDNFTEDDNAKAKFYEGFLHDEPQNSHVSGFILDQLFTGKVSDDNVTYFIEPANTFFNNMHGDSRKLVIFKNTDIRPLQRNIFPKLSKDMPEWIVLSRSPNISKNITVENSGLDITNGTEDLFCEIEVVADHTLYIFFKKNISRLIAILYLHGKFADYIFRNTDFNMDGVVDRIRIIVSKISIYKSRNEDNYPMAQATSLSDYLTQFAFRKQESKFCLSIGMIHRKYSGMAIGEAFRAENRFEDAIGGICDEPVPNYSGFGMIYFNTGVINARFQNSTTLPLAVTLLAFTHEIAHGFGSGHDPLKHPVCSPGKPTGNYLMYPSSTYGSKNAMRFSPCSRRSVWQILLLKGGCLKYTEAKCGNGIREGHEECDCGSQDSCDLIDPCCTPYDADPPEKGCTIRSSKGYKCSPKESGCCHKNCSIVHDTKTVCYSDYLKCFISVCDGENATCPKPEKVPDSLCRPKLCINDTCGNYTACISHGLEHCLCTQNITDECFQCCRKGNSCIPAKEFGILNSNNEPFILQPGTSCNNGKFECDFSGNCTGYFYLVETPLALYISLIVVPLFISVFLVIAICTSWKKNDVHIINTRDRT